MQLPTLLLILLSTSCTARSIQAASAADSLDVAPIPSRDVPQHPDPAVPGSRASKSDVGTKDAPVDGLDGKPHAGPFVDPLQQDATRAKANMVGLDAKEKTIAEDSVMNDPHRSAPRKGTTGTEGGVSEKDRERKATESEIGSKVPKKPEAPKELPVQAGIEHTRAANAPKDKPDGTNVALSDKSSSREGLSSETKERPKGAPGIEKPHNLPDTPHGVSHADSLIKQKESSSMSSKGLPSLDADDLIGVKPDVIPWDSLMGSFSSIAATEIGDKTFIVAALMAMRHPRLQVFSAAFSALFIMTILSGLTGHAVGSLISKKWAAVIAAILFFVFGAKSIKEGAEMDPNQGVSEEIREVQAELEEKEEDMARLHRRPSSISPYALEAGRAPGSRSRSHLASGKRTPSSSPSRSPPRASVAGVKNLLSLLLSPAWVETFSMTFVGELGDRSQIATVAMAAGQEYFWVMVGATLGHFVCTAVAVLGGSVLAGRITMRKVTLIGGAIFIGFGFFTLTEAVSYWR